MSFSESEKKIIEKLIKIKDLENRALNKYIYDDTHYIALKWDKAKVEIYFKKDPSDSLLIETWDSLCETLFLFKRLESNNLIGTYSIKGFDDNKDIDNNVLFNRDKYSYNKQLNIYLEQGKGDDRNIKFFNSDIGKYLDKYAHSYVYVSQSLKELEKKNLKQKNK